MHNFKSVIFASLVAGTLIAPIGSVWGDEPERRDRERDRFEDLKDRFERERDRWERDGRSGRRGRDDRDIRLSGTVEYVDKKRQAFSVRERADRVVTVVVPSDIAREDRERFAQLRKGENVRLAVRVDTNGKQYRLGRVQINARYDGRLTRRGRDVILL